MQGQCNTPLPKSEVFVAVQGRCVIDVPGPFLQAEGQDLLLSNVHVRLVRQPTATRQVTLVSLTAGSLWILNSQFDGTDAGANTRGFEVFPDRQLYMRGAHPPLPTCTWSLSPRHARDARAARTAPRCDS